MGWAQPVTSGNNNSTTTNNKRQLSQIQEGDRDCDMTDENNGCSDANLLRAKLNKRSREMSPPRKPLSTHLDYSSPPPHPTDICSIKSEFQLTDESSLKEKELELKEEFEFVCGKNPIPRHGSTDTDISCIANFGSSSEESLSTILPLDIDVTDSAGSTIHRLGSGVRADGTLNKYTGNMESMSFQQEKYFPAKSKGKLNLALTAAPKPNPIFARGTQGLKQSNLSSSSDTNSSQDESNEEEYSTADEETEEETDVESGSSTTVSNSEQTSIPQSESEVAEGSSVIDSSESADNLPVVTKPTKIVPVFRPSYFSYVPPYINFSQHDEIGETLPEEVKKLMKWRLSPITPVVIRKTVSNTGFRLLRKSVEWSGQWGKHMKANLFRGALKDYQKLNHLPATFQIGRKDRLWKNYNRFLMKFGKSEFGFLPRTYILPNETKQLKQAWDAAEKGRPWIVKPPANARGTGIRVINKWGQVPKKKPFIVQKYITNPMLINGRKFDLRLYVLVTNFHPLKIYIYRDGLVRFAPLKYSHDTKRVSDRFMHLTNYSINKNCDLYTHNEDADATQGHKWTLKTLWRYLKEHGQDVDTLWNKIEDIAIKTILSAEDSITANAFQIPNRYNGYELFGFDIILDEKLKPWLLEVNISPSLHSSSPLDLAVKGPLVKEVFNLVGYHLPPTMSNSLRKSFMSNVGSKARLETPVFDKRLYSCTLSKEEKGKQAAMRPHWDDRQKYLKDIASSLTPDDVRHLITAEDELGQCDGFTRIFPNRESHKYFAFLDGPRYYNMLFDAWEQKYSTNREAGIKRLQLLCDDKFHLQGTQSPNSPTSDNMPIFPKMLSNYSPDPNGNNSNSLSESLPVETTTTNSTSSCSYEDLKNGNFVFPNPTEVPSQQLTSALVNS